MQAGADRAGDVGLELGAAEAEQPVAVLADARAGGGEPLGGHLDRPAGTVAQQGAATVLVAAVDHHGVVGAAAELGG